MTYGELIDLYFQRSSALQWYWTLYVVILGGLLAFSSLRQRPDCITATLVTILYICFAFKNLGAIRDTTYERFAILQAIHDLPSDVSVPSMSRTRSLIEPTLNPPPYKGVRNFHVTCDILTVAALWAMERRRKKIYKETHAPDKA